MTRRLLRTTLAVALALATAGAALPAAAQAPTGRKLVVDRVAAVVNDAIIMQSELDARMAPMRQEIRQIADPKERSRRAAKVQNQVLTEMINDELIVQAAQDSKIEVEPGEVNAAVDEIKRENKLDDAALAQVLAQQGFTMASYKSDLRKQILRLRATNQLVRPRVNVSNEDVRARYDQMQRRSEAVSSIRLSHMLFKLPEHPTEQQLAEAKERAAKAITRVRGGEAFAAVAGEMSDDDGTKATGGELGWFERGSIGPEWETVVFAMDKGEVRGPISGPQGLHVFTVQEVKRSDLKPFEELKEQLKAELTRRETDKQSRLWIEDLRKKAHIDIKQ
ncbi:MAG: peptidylprolyl isomerase [Myxococcales bacterium]|nr:peptidylprolyl isomerase [Myxococcales bacterium]HRC55936.1 peptidylprolyl isomerase [Kofleriaceae bacterium]